MKNKQTKKPPPTKNNKTQLIIGCRQMLHVGNVFTYDSPRTLSLSSEKMHWWWERASYLSAFLFASYSPFVPISSFPALSQARD